MTKVSFKSRIANTNTRIIIACSLVWTWTITRTKYLWNETCFWFKEALFGHVLKKSLLEQSWACLPKSQSQIPVELSHFPVLLQFPGQIHSEQSIPFVREMQPHIPVVESQIPFPLQGEFPPGHEISIELIHLISKIQKIKKINLNSYLDKFLLHIQNHKCKHPMYYHKVHD